MTKETVAFIVDRLQQLQNLSEQAYPPNENYNNYVAYQSQIKHFEEKYRYHENLSVQQALLKAWIPYVKYNVFSSFAPLGFVDDTYAFLKFVTKTQQIQPVLAIDDGSSLVAGALLLCAHTIDNAGGYDVHVLNTVLLQLGFTTTIKESPTMVEDLTKILYGPLVWDMYTSPSLNVFLLHRHLQSEKIQPLKPPVTNSTGLGTKTVLIDLPSDM